MYIFNVNSMHIYSMHAFALVIIIITILPYDTKFVFNFTKYISLIFRLNCYPSTSTSSDVNFMSSLVRFIYKVHDNLLIK